jgi:hypothetical protein
VSRTDVVAPFVPLGRWPRSTLLRGSISLSCEAATAMSSRRPIGCRLNSSIEQYVRSSSMERASSWRVKVWWAVVTHSHQLPEPPAAHADRSTLLSRAIRSIAHNNPRATDRANGVITLVGALRCGFRSDSSLHLHSADGGIEARCLSALATWRWRTRCTIDIPGDSDRRHCCTLRWCTVKYCCTRFAN